MKSWLKQPFGKKLKKLHSWNAWIVLILAVTGIILYIPSLRGPLASIRVWLKEFHIIVGFISIVILLLYVPLISRHLKQIWNKRAQHFNLWLVLILILGWSLSGLILWQYQNVPSGWSTTALILHDLFTWVGVPYAIYHSISRSRWLKRVAPKQKKIYSHTQVENVPLTADQYIDSKYKNYPMSRRTFLRGLTGLFLLVSIGPSFYRWVKGAFDRGGSTLKALTETNGNNMIPDPTPSPQSQLPIGGGAKGDFRIYSVTEIPSFSSDNWKFVIGGLVDKPITFSWQEFLKIKRQFQVSDFHCITGWSVRSITWEGIPVSYLLDQAGVQSKAKYVKFYSGDGVYTDVLSLKQARMEDVIVAVLMDGQPIPQKLGGPVRLVTPKMYAYKSVKWVQAIKLIEKEELGYWEKLGYDKDGWLTSYPMDVN